MPEIVRLVWRVGRRVALRYIDTDGPILAGHIAFSTMLALFPFLIFMAALAGFVGDAAAGERFIDMMFEFVPADVAEVLAPAVMDVVSNRKGGLMTLGAVLTLWIASNGVEALRDGLNTAFAVKEPRALWRRRLQSLLAVVLVSAGLLVLTVAVVLGPVLWELFESVAGTDLSLRALWDVLRYAIATAVLTALVFGLYRWLPRISLPPSRLWPGALFAAVLWLAGASLFSIYLGNIANYSRFYGSLGGVMITLVFMYFSATVFLLGAQLNTAFYGVRRLRADAEEPTAEIETREDTCAPEKGAVEEHN